MPDLSALAGLGGGGLLGLDASSGGGAGSLQDMLGGLSFAQISSDHAQAANPLQGLMLSQIGSLSSSSPVSNPGDQMTP